MLASANGRADIVSKLTESGVNVDFTGWVSSTVKLNSVVLLEYFCLCGMAMHYLCQVITFGIV